MRYLHDYGLMGAILANAAVFSIGDPYDLPIRRTTTWHPSEPKHLTKKRKAVLTRRSVDKANRKRGRK